MQERKENVLQTHVQLDAYALWLKQRAYHRGRSVSMAELEERLERNTNRIPVPQTTIPQQFDLYAFDMYTNTRDRILASTICVPVITSLDKRVQQLIYAQTAKAVFDLFPVEVDALFIKKELQHPRPVLKKGNGLWQPKTR